MRKHVVASLCNVESSLPLAFLVACTFRPGLSKTHSNEPMQAPFCVKYVTIAACGRDIPLEDYRSCDLMGGQFFSRLAAYCLLDPARRVPLLPTRVGYSS